MHGEIAQVNNRETKYETAITKGCREAFSALREGWEDTFWKEVEPTLQEKVAEEIEELQQEMQEERKAVIKDGMERIEQISHQLEHRVQLTLNIMVTERKYMTKHVMQSSKTTIKTRGKQTKEHTTRVIRKRHKRTPNRNYTTRNTTERKMTEYYSI